MTNTVTTRFGINRGNPNNVYSEVSIKKPQEPSIRITDNGNQKKAKPVSQEPSTEDIRVDLGFAQIQIEPSEKCSNFEQSSKLGLRADGSRDWSLVNTLIFQRGRIRIKSSVIIW